MDISKLIDDTLYKCAHDVADGKFENIIKTYHVLHKVGGQPVQLLSNK